MIGRLTSALGGNRKRLSRPLLVALGALIVVGAAYGVASLAAGSGGEGSGRPAWLGVDMAGPSFPAATFPSGGSGFPFVHGALVVYVMPGGPGEAAGLEPGAVITEIDNQKVSSPAQVNSILARLHVGDRVQIQYDKALTMYTTKIALTARPAGSP